MLREARRPGRHDHRPVCGRHDRARHRLAKTVGTEPSHETISSITDTVADVVPGWRERPLDGFYPVMCLDAIRVKVRDGGRVV